MAASANICYITIGQKNKTNMKVASQYYKNLKTPAVFPTLHSRKSQGTWRGLAFK